MKKGFGIGMVALVLHAREKWPHPTATKLSFFPESALTSWSLLHQGTRLATVSLTKLLCTSLAGWGHQDSGGWSWLVSCGGARGSLEGCTFGSCMKQLWPVVIGVQLLLYSGCPECSYSDPGREVLHLVLLGNEGRNVLHSKAAKLCF